MSAYGSYFLIGLVVALVFAYFTKPNQQIAAREWALLILLCIALWPIYTALFLIELAKGSDDAA